MEQKYQYNQKELNSDFGLLWSDYGARWLDLQRGVWGQIDPLAEKYYGWSGYNYVAGNPIKHIDPDGRSFGWYEIDGIGGTVIFNPKINSQADLDATGQQGNYIGSSFANADEYGTKYYAPNGTTGESIPLREVVITPSASLEDVDKVTGKVDVVANALSIPLGVKEGMWESVANIKPGTLESSPIKQMLKATKQVGATLSFIGLGISMYDFGRNPTVGNGLKVLWDVGMVSAGPAGGVADAIFEASGAKDAMFKFVDKEVKRYQYRHKWGPIDNPKELQYQYPGSAGQQGSTPSYYR